MKPTAASNTEMPELLRRLARQTLEDHFLTSINGSDIYQVPQGWQKELMAADASVHTVMSATKFEEAVASPDVHSIFVPNHAALTQEIVERILLRNPLAKTIYWEAGASADTA